MPPLVATSAHVHVQATRCAPIVRAFEFDVGCENAPGFLEAHTVASALRVPKAVSDFFMLRILRESNGGAFRVDDARLSVIVIFWSGVGSRSATRLAPTSPRRTATAEIAPERDFTSAISEVAPSETPVPPGEATARFAQSVI